MDVVDRKDSGVDRFRFQTRDTNIEDPEPTKFIDIVKRWPKSTFCIIGNEFCERFSYYGMRTVLTLYLINILGFSGNKATIFFHAFTVFAYSSPLLGSILADGYIGKFWTIFSISLVYAAGQIILAVASTFGKESAVHPTMDLVGLLIIALGTGGIKPCVSAFGGDQFPSHYIKMLSIFFSVFYFMVNAGSTVSTFITPEFRATSCLGVDSCYPLAFGVPAVLMIIATIFFMAGSFYYTKVPPKENVISRVVVTIGRAISNRFTAKRKQDHWLDYALEKHECKNDQRCLALAVKDKTVGEKCAQKVFVKDVKTLVRVCVMMLPVPMFWSLYDQQGSRWIIQAVAMDAQITSSFSILPDQMGTLNAIMIMAFIPIFQIIVYPLVEKCGIRTTSLRRMAVGGLLAAVSFSICGVVQLSVNKTLPDVPTGKQAFVSVINSFPNCNFVIDIENFHLKSLRANSSLIDNKISGNANDLHLYRFNVSSSLPVQKKFSFKSSDPSCPRNFTITTSLKGGKAYYIDLTPHGWMSSTNGWEKPQEGEGQFAMSLNLLIPCESINPRVTWKNCSKGETYNGIVALCKQDKNTDPIHPCNPKNDKYYAWNTVIRHDADVMEYSQSNKVFTGSVLDSIDVKPGSYQAYYVNYLAHRANKRPTAQQTEAVPIEGIAFSITKMGGVYTLTATTDQVGQSNIMNIHTIVPDNHVHILWQIPQYVVITAAEILFSITGLEFAYSEASPELKSVVQAIWLFTVAIGDLIIILITEANLFQNLATEMFVFAGAMVVVIGIFILLSVFYYEYADFNSDPLEYDLTDNQSSSCQSTLAMDDAESFISIKL